MKLKATAQYHTTPVSGKLTSNFIELSFGFQESGLGAEMFFNRSFEPTVPYRTIHKMCSYMLSEDENPGASYEPDWRKLEWYHSGYEHNAWFAFPVPDGEYRGYIMYADSLTATNMPGKEQICESGSTLNVEGRTVKMTVEKLSFAEYVIPLV